MKIYDEVESEFATPSTEQNATGQAILVHLEICLKLSTLHNLNNDAFEHPIASLCESVNMGLQNHSSLKLQFAGSNFFINGSHINVGFEQLEAMQTVRVFFESCKISEMIFGEEFHEENFRSLLQLYQRHYQLFSLNEIPNETINNIGFRKVTEAQDNESTNPGKRTPEQMLLEKFSALIVAIHQADERIARGQQVPLRTIRRLIQRVLQAAEGQEALAVALTQTKANAKTGAFQTASTILLCGFMGESLGLKRSAIMELCISSFLLGRHVFSQAPEQTVSAEAQEEADSRDLDFRAAIQMIQNGITLGSLARAIRTLEMQLPLGGVQIGRSGDLLDDQTVLRPDFSARFLAVPFAFQTLTNSPYCETRLLPSQAMRYLLDRASTQREEAAIQLSNASVHRSTPCLFELKLVHAFANTIGLFPIGSSVRLRNGDIAIVTGIPRYPNSFSKPQVKIVQSSTGPTNIIIDLSTTTNEILEPVEDFKHGINVPMVFLA